MPIINKGIFEGNEVFQRQVGNDWPTAQVITTSDVIEATNLYFTNTRVAANVTTLMQSFQGDGIEIEANGRISANVLNVQFAETANSISNFTTDDLSEGNVNLYFTNTRVAANVTTLMQSFQGDNIIIEANGRISANIFVAQTVESLDNLTTDDLDEGNVNLYFTNTRVAGNVTTLMQSFQGDNIIIEANGRISANIFNVQSAETANSISNFTTDDLDEGNTNLYFTIARAREAYTEGQGIAISANGVISTRGDDTGLGLFNSGINLAANLKPSGTYQTIKTFPAIEGNTFIVFSLLATNRSSNTSYLSARVDTDGNTIMLANLLKLPPNSSTEVFRKPQIFKIDDSIEILSLNQNKAPAANLINTYISYQATLDDTFNRSIISISDNEPYMLYQSRERTSIIESLNLVNLGPNVMPVDAYITNNANQLVTYLVANLVIPAHTSVEICEYPKALLDNDKIWIQKWDNPKEMSVFVSSKITSSYEVNPSTTVIIEGDSIIFDIITTNVLDGTVLYYELQQV